MLINVITNMFELKVVFITKAGNKAEISIPSGFKKLAQKCMAYDACWNSFFFRKDGEKQLYAYQIAGVLSDAVSRLQEYREHYKNLGLYPPQEKTKKSFWSRIKPKSDDTWIERNPNDDYFELFQFLSTYLIICRLNPKAKIKIIREDY